MKTFVIALACTIAALASPPSWAAGSGMAIPGFYNVTTGTMMPMATKVPAAAPVVSTGTVKISITLGIEAAIGTDESISCQATIYASDASFSNTASASGAVVRSGAKGTVVLTIPYDWTMAAAGEMATISLSCSESYGVAVGHSINFVVPGFAVPKGVGAVTTKSLTASM